MSNETTQSGSDQLDLGQVEDALVSYCARRVRRPSMSWAARCRESSYARCWFSTNTWPRARSHQRTGSMPRRVLAAVCRLYLHPEPGTA